MNLIISNASEEPIYQQIIDQIKSEILTGHLRPDEALPSIRGLAKELKISVITTKKAYEELERDGFIVSAQGRGSFVAPQNRELLKESRLKRVEEALGAAVETAASMGVTREEVEQILRLLYEEE